MLIDMCAYVVSTRCAEGETEPHTMAAELGSNAAAVAAAALPLPRARVMGGGGDASCRRGGVGAEPPLSIFSVTTLYTCRSPRARNEASHRRGCGEGVGAAEPARGCGCGAHTNARSGRGLCKRHGAQRHQGDPKISSPPQARAREAGRSLHRQGW